MVPKATALVQTGPRKQEFQEFDLPSLPPGAVLLRVEANGICRSDVASFEGDTRTGSALPRINGHEIVGIIEEMGPRTSARTGVSVGDRVALNPWLSCGRCRACLRGDMLYCSGARFQPACYGFISTAEEPSLWGGYSTHVYVDPDAILYPFPLSVPAARATLWNPLGAGVQFGVVAAGTTVGTRIAVLGSGQRGLSCVAAARLAGAGTIITTGLPRDRHKLDLALEFGADVAIDVEEQSPVDVALELSDGEGFDVVVDTIPHAPHSTYEGLDMLRKGGKLVLVAMKQQLTDDFPLAKLMSRSLSIVGANGVSHESYLRARDMIVDDRLPLGKMQTHTFGFDRFEEAIDTLQGNVPGANAINVVVTPTFTS